MTNVKIGKKIVSLAICVALAACLGTATAFATGEADDGFIMNTVSDIPVETPENPADNTTEPQEETTVSAEGVEVSGSIPEGVEVTMSDVEEADYADGVSEAVGDAEILFANDITMTDDWQPEEGAAVTVSLDAAELGLEDGDVIGILHEHEGEFIDLGEHVVSDGRLSFETGGFSVFYGYTVDFEYEGAWYSMGGQGSIYLYELFAALGIKGFDAADAVRVEFSNPDLIDASLVVIDDFTGETSWYLRSLAPFDTKETLTVEFADGKAIAINVYDATHAALSNNLTLNDGDVINGATVSGNVQIMLNGDVTIKNMISVPAGSSLKITGSGALLRDPSYTGRMLSVNGGTLTIEGSGIAIDGGSTWASTEVPGSTREKLAVTAGASAVGSGIYVDQNGVVNLSGITLRNLYTTSGQSQAPAIHVTGDSRGQKDGSGNPVTYDEKHATVNMTNVTITGCATMSGQAIALFNDCLATLNSCTITDNYSGGTYAGALKAGGSNYFSQLNMTNCTATGNYSSGWGGVVLWAANSACGGLEAKAVIDGCTLNSNKARYLGGALSNEAKMEISNTTIKGNVAMAGGGIATFPFSLTETHESGNEACGLSVRTGNVIESNIAVATGDFTPYQWQDVNESGTVSAKVDGVTKTRNSYNSDPVISDDTAIYAPTTYPAGGGGIWCYMNKAGWTCSLEIGAGNTIKLNDASNLGGGVYVHNKASAGTTLTISGAEIFDNDAANGGGVYVHSGDLTLTGGTISSNTAIGNGGGAYVSGTGSITMKGGTVTGNDAVDGGGAYVSGTGGFTMEDGAISSNTATGNGGGAYVSGTGGFTMKYGAVSGNAATNGGGIYANGGSVTVESGSLTENTVSEKTSGNAEAGSEGYGGGAFANGGNVTIGIQDCTRTISKHEAPKTHPEVKNNTAVFGGGLAVRGGTVNIHCCSIMQNQSNNDGTGKNVFIDGGSVTQYTNGAEIGDAEDHGMVSIGGTLDIVGATNTKVTIVYHPNFAAEGLTDWEGSAPEGYRLNLPYCPTEWKEKQGANYVFVGWTEGKALSSDPSDVRKRSDYKETGTATTITDGTPEDNTTHFYAVWAPATSTISYAYCIVGSDVKTDKPELFATAPIVYSYRTVSESLPIASPSIPGYELTDWRILASPEKISNWNADEIEDTSPGSISLLAGGAGLPELGKIKSALAGSGLGVMSIGGSSSTLTTDRNFGDITLVAVFEPAFAGLTISKVNSGVTDQMQSFLFLVNGDPNDSSLPNFSMTVSVHGAGKVVIDHLPVGMYSATADDGWSWRYFPTNDNSGNASAPSTEITPWPTQSATLSDPNSGATLNFNEPRSDQQWLSGEHYKTFKIE